MNNALNTSALIVDDLHHSFRKPKPFWELRADFKTVLDGIDLTLNPGTITALLGRNGSGKSTLMMCILGLIKANSGEAILLNEKSWELSDAVRQRVGYVPQYFDYFRGVHVNSLLKQWGSYYSQWDPEFVRHLRLNLELNENERVLTLSEGQRQKLAIILAMGHKPDVLILDEPVSSLDPIARLNFVKLLANDYMDETKTVLYSTHITSDVERITTHVAILKAHKILLHRELDDIKENLIQVHLNPDEEHSELCPESLSQRATPDGTTVITDKRLLDPAIIARSQNLSLEELYWELDQ